MPETNPTLKIESIAYGGSGIARHDGIVYFVPGVLPGETVIATPVLKKKNYIIAKALKIVEPSPKRIPPKCPYALQVSDDQSVSCPGCQYQHMEYDEELKVKNTQFGELLERFAKVSPELRKDPVASPEHLGYRNKITLHAFPHKDKLELGYYTSNNTSLIEIENCPLACQQINTLLNELKTGETLDIPTPSTLTLRYTEKDGSSYWIRPKKEDTHYTGQSTASKSPYLTETTSSGEFLVPRRSFSQINLYLRDKLIKETVRILEENKTDYLFDLFCGVGTFGISAAETLKFEKVYASDIDTNAIGAARKNAASHKLENVKLFAMPAIKAANRIFREIDPKKNYIGS